MVYVQTVTNKGEKVWGQGGQARRGRREGPNEEIGAYHREGPPLSSLLCSLPSMEQNNARDAMCYPVWQNNCPGERIVHFKSSLQNVDCKVST